MIGRSGPQCRQTLTCLSSRRIRLRQLPNLRSAQTSPAQPVQTSPANRAVPQTTSSSGAAVVPPPTAPAAQKVSTESSSVNPPAGTSFEVVVRPKDSAWVSIKSDGSYVVRGIIRPPDVKTIHATSQVVFYTGNAGAVEVSFNGKNVPLTGGPNAEQVLVFDSRGIVPDRRSKTVAPLPHSNP